MRERSGRENKTRLWQLKKERVAQKPAVLPIEKERVVKNPAVFCPPKRTDQKPKTKIRNVVVRVSGSDGWRELKKAAGDRRREAAGEKIKARNGREETARLSLGGIHGMWDGRLPPEQNRQFKAQPQARPGITRVIPSVCKPRQLAKREAYTRLQRWWKDQI